MEMSEIISIIDILVTIIVGFWLTRYFSIHDSRSRVLKDYYIDEVKVLQNDVRTFFARLLSNHIPGSELSRWYKSHKNKFYTFDSNIRESFPIECPRVSEELFKLHHEITNFEEFNNGFSNGEFNFRPQTRKRISELECDALSLLNDYLIQVNSSPGHGYVSRKISNLRHEFRYYILKTHSYLKYVLIWILRLLWSVGILAIVIFSIRNLQKWYLAYAKEKTSEKLIMQQNINKAIECIESQNAKLDSIDVDLRMIKDNMRLRKGVNNYWIHTNCKEESTIE